MARSSCDMCIVSSRFFASFELIVPRHSATSRIIFLISWCMFFLVSVNSFSAFTAFMRLFICPCVSDCLTGAACRGPEDSIAPTGSSDPFGLICVCAAYNWWRPRHFCASSAEFDPNASVLCFVGHFWVFDFPSTSLARGLPYPPRG